MLDVMQVDQPWESQPPPKHGKQFSPINVSCNLIRLQIHMVYQNHVKPIWGVIPWEHQFMLAELKLMRTLIQL